MPLGSEQQVAWNASFLQELPSHELGLRPAPGPLSLDPVGTCQPPAAISPSIKCELFEYFLPVTIGKAPAESFPVKSLQVLCMHPHAV